MTKINPKAKILVLVKTNPTRKGTARYDRVKRLLAHKGKPVEAFVEAGGRLGTLAYAVEHEWIKLSASKR
jgi:hypothetical protein